LDQKIQMTKMEIAVQSTLTVRLPRVTRTLMVLSGLNLMSSVLTNKLNSWTMMQVPTKSSKEESVIAGSLELYL